MVTQADGVIGVDLVVVDVLTKGTVVDGIVCSPGELRSSW